MNNWLLLSLLTAHVIGDFYLQSDKYCKRKEEAKNQKSLFIYSFCNHGSAFLGVCSGCRLLVFCADYICSTFID